MSNLSKDREVDSKGNCSKCGGTHYGSYMCPMVESLQDETINEGADIRKDSVRQARDTPCDALSADTVAAAERPRRRFQCTTLAAESVVLNASDFDAMSAELDRLRKRDPGSVDERADAWGTVFERLLEIDPRLGDRANSGLGCALHLINELAARPKHD